MLCTATAYYEFYHKSGAGEMFATTLTAVVQCTPALILKMDAASARIIAPRIKWV